MMAPEFSRPVRIDTLGEGGRSIEIEADEGERAALALRFELIAISSLSATADIKRQGDIVTAEGRVRASVVQVCVASAGPVPAEIDEPFSLRFVPEGQGEVEEIELTPEDWDTIDYAGSAIDLGEAVAETMALSLDPFPRASDADIALREAGVLSEEQAAEASSPFAALRGLTKKS